MVTHASAIVWAAQMGAITLHPWQVRCPDTDHPDELRIDLDPQPGTGFARSPDHRRRHPQAVARRTRSGGLPEDLRGRGIHVFLRIRTDWDFVAVRRAGIALARKSNVGHRPRHHLMVEGATGSKLFIDYNQNARDRTFAAAYSVRPTPIATVSTPLHLERIGRRRNAGRLHHGDRTGLVAPAGDPMAEMDSLSQSIEPCWRWPTQTPNAGGDLPYPPNYPKMPGGPKRVQPSRDRDLKGKTRLGDAQAGCPSCDPNAEGHRAPGRMAGPGVR